MATIEIKVAGKTATLADRNAYIVCNNKDYVIKFKFDEQWSNHLLKTARFVYDGEYQDVVFAGDNCTMPEIYGKTTVGIGVYAGDLITTTPAIIDARESILSGDPIHADPEPDVYNQIIELIEAGAVKGEPGNGIESIELTDEEVTEETVIRTYTITYTEGDPTTFEVTSINSGYAQRIIHDAETAKTGAEEAKSSAESAALSATQSKDSAQNSALSAATSAQTASNAASASHQYAQSAFNDAQASSLAAGTATSAAQAASESKEAAKTSKEAAAQSASDALSSKTAAAASEQAAESAKTDAQSARTGAVQAKNDAESAKTASETAKTAAETAKTNAESARDDAESARDDVEESINGCNQEQTQLSVEDKVDAIMNLLAYIVEHGTSGSLNGFELNMDPETKSVILSYEDPQTGDIYDPVYVPTNDTGLAIVNKLQDIADSLKLIVEGGN